jgi:multidrug transporter EmrE-like cation transporter
VAVSVPSMTPTPTLKKPFTREQSIGLVFGCTILGAVAQVLIKYGANSLTHGNPLLMLTNVPLVLGYCFYGLSTVLLIFALRDGQLSLLYPVISLTYVWVTIVSATVFKENMNLLKILGVLVIVIGVGVLGRSGSGAKKSREVT